ncbi:MAG: GNAT family N-acetyltransferase [Actinomycetia bacterium]|nr:GNAT family N-acetyltransferase [Actinomycetes bacterium]
MAELRWVAHDDRLMRDATHLRWKVLMEPFGVTPDGDWDDADPHSQHLVALDEGLVVGYARLIDAAGAAQIRQVAVAFDRQRSGIGSALVRESVRAAREAGLDPIFLHSRAYAEAFYERLGFVTVSAEPFCYGRTGMPHVRMEVRTRPR